MPTFLISQAALTLTVALYDLSALCCGRRRRSVAPQAMRYPHLFLEAAETVALYTPSSTPPLQFV